MHLTLHPSHCLSSTFLVVKQCDGYKVKSHLCDFPMLSYIIPELESNFPTWLASRSLFSKYSSYKASVLYHLLLLLWIKFSYLNLQHIWNPPLFILVAVVKDKQVP